MGISRETGVGLGTATCVPDNGTGVDTLTITTAGGKSRLTRGEYETLLRDQSQYAWIVDGVPVRPVVRRDGNEFALTSEEYELLILLIRSPGHPVPFSAVKELLDAATDNSAQKRFNGARAKVEPAHANKKATRAARAFKHRGTVPDRTYAFEPSEGLAYALVEREDSAPEPAPARDALRVLEAFLQDIFPPIEVRGSECDGVRVGVLDCLPGPHRLDLHLRIENIGRGQQVIDGLELLFGGQRLRCRRVRSGRRDRTRLARPRPRVPRLPTTTFALAAGEVKQGYLAFPLPEAYQTRCSGEKEDVTGERSRTGSGALTLYGTIEVRLLGDEAKR